MRKNLFIFFFFIISLSLYSNELLIPFTENGKIGFVDENLHRVLEPQYVGSITANSKKMVLIDCKGYDALIGNNGQLLTRGVDGIFIVGEEKYAVSQGGGTGCVRIFSSLTKKQIHFYDKIGVYEVCEGGELLIRDYESLFGSRYNILNEDGEPLFRNNTFKRIFGFDSNSKTAFVQDAVFDDSLVSIDGKIINNNSFQFGMRSLGEGFVFGKNKKTGETGYYNMNCELVIKAGVEKGINMDDWNSFPPVKCGVVALVFDGERYILLSEGEWQIFHSDNWCIVDKKGIVQANGITADYIFPFSDDVAVLRLKEGTVWTFSLIDKNGNYVTTEKYDQIYSSVNGYCMAKKNNIDYLIRSKDGTAIKCSDLK